MIALSSVKHQLRLEIDDNSEDDHLLHLVDAALESVELYLNRKMYASSAMLAADTAAPVGSMVITASIKQAVLMVVSELYNNREATTFSRVADNPAISLLLSPHRRIEGLD